MSLRRICKHRVTIYRQVESDELIDGEPDIDDDVPSGTFLGALFTPSGSESNRRGREVKEPTLMYLPSAPRVEKEDELGIVAAEQNAQAGLAADAEVRWQVVGTPQSLGRPGRTPKAMMVVLRKVDD